MYKSRVIRDEKITPYVAEIRSKREDSSKYWLVFKFSSPKYIEKFNHRVYDNRKKINESLSNRFGFEIENNKLCDIKLYMTLEIRGFYIECKEGVVEWPSNIKLNGENRIQKK